jgi:two-component system, NtrC family, response regulator AtoC
MSNSIEGNLQALVIEDEPKVCEFVSAVLQEEGWSVVQSRSAEDAFERLNESPWSVVFCDVMVGGANGYSVLHRFKEKMPQAKVVLMTGHGSAAAALDETAFGAYDYLLKPIGPEELQSLSKALREQLAECPQRSSPTGRVAAYHSEIELVGRSQAFIEVMQQVGRVAGTNFPVLLTGESGTGKQLVASAIHHRSGRSDQPFVVVNCGAIPAELVEAELFGHVKGSSASGPNKRGLWEEADGGTVFLDEVMEINSSVQEKLLRALQTGEISRAGSNETQKVDVRVIAASTLNVEQEVAAGRFRKDLYYRLNTVSIVLPPLRERPEDIPPLAQSFADRVYSLSPSVKFSTDALALLERYNWPGNIRELENAVVRAVAMCDGTIRVKDLPERVRSFSVKQAEGSETALDRPANDDWVTLSEIEGRYVARVLDHTGGNKQAAARVLAVDRKTLDRMIKRHHITSHLTRRHRAKISEIA